MKLLFSCIIICALLWSANQVLAINYQITINEWIQNWEINNSQLSAAKLLQKYLETYRQKINQLYNLYEASNPVAISTFNKQISDMSENLYKIQNNQVSNTQAQKIIPQVVSDLKIINTRMKVFLEQEKLLYQQKLQKKQLVLSEIGKKVSQTLDKLLLSLSTKLLDKEVLSEKEKKLVKILVTLREQNNKMKAFSNINFETEDEMKNYLKEVISSIRSEFKTIKSL